MSNYIDTNIIRNGLFALKALALDKADEYLERLADDGLSALERISENKGGDNVNGKKENPTKSQTE